MAKKAELLEQAHALKLDVSEKNTIAEIEAALQGAEKKKGNTTGDKEIVAERKASVAKAGKRSEKAIEEAEEKAEKEARKAAHDTTAQGDVEAHPGERAVAAQIGTEPEQSGRCRAQRVGQ